MITFSMIGNHGRLGNQMFQYSLLKSISKKNNFIFAIPKQNHQLFECFDIKCKVYDIDKSAPLLQKMKVYRENGFNYDNNVYRCGDDVNYVGNYQTEKYFNWLREEILHDFSFKKEIKEASENIFNRFKKNKKIVSLHVRRGDYVNLQNFHPVCSIEYYENAMKHFNDCDVICFSDDIKWCEQNLKHLSKNILFCDSGSPYIDLCLMSMCDHNIIANSTFSWWAAWLNTNNGKIVVAPKKWFGPDYDYHNIEDLIPNNWLQV